MKPNLCQKLQKKALDKGLNSAAWFNWKQHASDCDPCAQDQKVWHSLHALAQRPVEGLGEVRIAALRTTLAQRPRSFKGRWWAFPSLAFGIGLLILVIWFLPANEPFSIETEPNKWAQIAANPEWDLRTNSPLRDRIETMRTDFRLAKSPTPDQLQKNTELKSRMERLRHHLED